MDSLTQELLSICEALSEPESLSIDKNRLASVLLAMSSLVSYLDTHKGADLGEGVDFPQVVDTISGPRSSHPVMAAMVARYARIPMAADSSVPTPSEVAEVNELVLPFNRALAKGEQTPAEERGEAWGISFRRSAIIKGTDVDPFGSLAQTDDGDPFVPNLDGFDSAVDAKIARLRGWLDEHGRPSLSAYYYSFESTGDPKIDLILSMVARAGKHAHSTHVWEDDEYEFEQHPLSLAAMIQLAANLAADPMPPTEKPNECVWAYIFEPPIDGDEDE